jgi:Ca2+-transporting ATPase
MPLQHPELLDDKPHGRYEPLITGQMYINLTAAAFYKLFWLLGCLYGLPRIIPKYQ